MSLPIALITGAASGLGAALARLLAERYQLILVDRDSKGLQALGLAAELYPCDLTDRDALAQLAEHVRMQYRQLDLLVNNAGIAHRSLASDTELSVLEQVMAVDFFAPVQLCQALLPALQASTQAQIVVVGSMAS